MKRAVAILAATLVVSQLVAWFLATAFGYQFGSESYGQIASIAVLIWLLTAPIVLVVFMESKR